MFATTAITRLMMFIAMFVGASALAACFQGDIKPEQISAKLKQPSVVISWSGLLKDFGHIAVGDETKSLQDFSCFPNDSYVAEPTSHDSFSCRMGDAGAFHLQLDHQSVQSILLHGKFGLQKVDDSGDGTLVINASTVNNLIAVHTVPQSVCDDIFPPDERHAASTSRPAARTAPSSSGVAQ